MTRALLAVAALVGPIGGLAAQVSAHGSALVARVHVRARVTDLTDDLVATGYGFEVGGRASVVSLHVRYLQGDLAPTAGSAAVPRGLAEVRVLLGVAPRPWLAAGIGPQRRTYTTTLGDQRWTVWQTVVRGTVPLVPDRAAGYLEAGWVFAGTSDATEPFDRGWTGEVGLRVTPVRLPASLVLAYRLDRYRLGGGGRTETVDAFLIGLGVRPR